MRPLHSKCKYVTHKVAVWMVFAYVLKFHLPSIIPLIMHTHLPHNPKHSTSLPASTMPKLQLGYSSLIHSSPHSVKKIFNILIT